MEGALFCLANYTEVTLRGTENTKKKLIKYKTKMEEQKKKLNRFIISA